ncbi:hypothetical protein A9P82_06455 [Arachidicoccus ginsenosidimutans]|uniref:SAM hydrolase/SAM-dependent halogenase family protein n=1 Tax=Arachidicoccus sp. BS20 TaxID=1850526 RepID=UPI0007F0AB4E|nr:SAM-dependent chlorinase/fluorinase [Arachidicoccus sp. BS20]ANI88966.1 hypothetical protein A9P82_06455 [Arachidicoccus sp. BS20]
MAIVTLSTDIGTYDFITGAFKGQLLSLHPALQVVDISHDLSSSNFAEAAYICQNAFKHFPGETIHIVIVNLFEFKPTHFLIAKYRSQYILCPDNGILTMIYKQKPAEVFKVNISHQAPLNTLQYLSAFAAATSKLVLGKYPLQIGEEFTNFTERYPMRPSFGGNWLEGQIIFIDKFENVVVNISKEEFEEYRDGRNYKISFGRNNIIDRIQENYSTVASEEFLAHFNSAGMLELSVKNGNLASLFGLQGYNEENSSQKARTWFYQSIRIFFE